MTEPRDVNVDVERTDEDKERQVDVTIAPENTDVEVQSGGLAVEVDLRRRQARARGGRQALTSRWHNRKTAGSPMSRPSFV